MGLSRADAEDHAADLYEIRQKERKRLLKIKAYLNGDPALTWLPQSAPQELQALAAISRIPLMDLVVKGTTQQMFLDGYVCHDEDQAARIWSVWQSNRFDRKQSSIHRAASAYGVAYAVIMPAEGADAPPVLRPVSPLKMTTAYGMDDDWPDYGLEERPDGTWRLYDEERHYTLKRSERKQRRQGERAVTFEYVDEDPHEQDVCPVVRYLADEDLDVPVRGDIEPIMPLQDVMNLTAFHLLLSQHYGSHGRAIYIGSMTDQLEKSLRASAGSSLTIKAHPSDFRVDTVPQSDLSGFIESREATARFLAAVSQTPTHELLGTLANLAAASLVEAREATARKVRERETNFGESHEQTLGQAGELLGIPMDPSARVRWQPAQDQRMFQLVEMLGNIADRLDVPTEALISELPFSDATLDSWKEAHKERRGRAPEQPQDQGNSVRSVAVAR